MGRLRFSIITPVHVFDEDRNNKFLRCIESVKKLDYSHDDFEHIIVNDGSTYPTKIPSYAWIKVVNQEHQNRIIALNRGLKEAQGEIICFLDSDDEYEDFYLGALDWLYLSNPKTKMFNFGCSYYHKDGSITYRDAFKPKKKRVGHEVFGGGNIVNGTFVFHRSIYKKLGGYPKDKYTNIDCTSINYPPFQGAPEPYIRDLTMTSPYDFSAYAQLEFPEIQQFFMVKHPDHPKGLVKELGNPWGNDYYLFYKYTRKYHSNPIDKYMYKVYPR